jgi:hypothetical protein
MRCLLSSAQPDETDLLQYKDRIEKIRSFQSFLARALLKDGRFSLLCPEYLQWIANLKEIGVPAVEISRYEDLVVSLFLGQDLVEWKKKRQF